MSLNLTREEILKEYIKCVNSPIYTIETYLETKDNTQGGFVPFILFNRQKEIVNAYETFRYNLVTKPRQAGISTTTQAYIAAKVGFSDPDNPEVILVIANKLRLAQKFLRGIADYLTQIPRWAWGPEYYGSEENLKKDLFIAKSKTELELPNGSQLIAVATSEDALRGYSPTWLIFDEAAFIDNGDAVYAAAMSSISTGGKVILISCVTDDTFVFTDKGIKQVKDFIRKDKTGPYIIDNYKILGKDKLRQSNIIHNNGLTETLIIESVNAKLEGSKNHKLYAYSNKDNKYDWYKLEDLNIGDYIGIQYGMNIWGNNDDVSEFIPEDNNRIKNIFNPTKITKDIAYLIGLYLSEGSVYKKYNEDNNLVGGALTITCGDDVSEIFNKLNLTYSSHDKLHYTVSSKHLIAFLEYLGFDLSYKAPNKIIPSRLLEMSKENIVAMLQGIFDSDGFSRKDKGTVGIVLSSKKLVEQIRIILNNFGILTDYYEVLTKPTKKVMVESINYRLQCDKHYSKIFYEEIGFRFERKMANNAILSNYNLARAGTQDIIPNSAKLLKKLYKHMGIPLKELTNNGIKIKHIVNRNNFQTNNISRDTFIKLINYYGKELPNGFNRELEIINQNIKWVPIKKIKESKNETYDFSLPNSNDFWCHSVIYNGIIGHQTPNGQDALYYKTYEKSKIGENNFHIVEMRWYEDPRYNKDLKWVKHNPETDTDIIEPEVEFTVESYQKRIANEFKPTSTWYEGMCSALNHNAKKIAQELDVSFLGSGGNVIDDKTIDWHEKHNVIEPMRKEGEESNIWIWADPIEGHQYIASVDVSRGDGEDSSTIVIIDFTTMEEVLEYQGKIQPDLLAELIYEYGKRYKAYAVVDITGGMGVATILKLIELDYKPIHYDKPNSKILNNKKELELANKADKIPGFNVNGVRLPMIAHFEMMIRTNGIKIRSRRLTSELKTFVYKNGRPDHIDGFHDDLIFSCAMALWVLEHSFKNLEKAQAQTKAILSAWSVGTSERANQPIMHSSGFVSKNNRNKVVAPRPRFHPDVSKNMQDPNGDYMWLFSGTM